MFTRRAFVPAALVVGLVASTPVLATEKFDYSDAAFDAAQKAGRSILVEIHATWCPTCKAQEPILSEIEKGSQFKNLVVFHVDFDSQKEAVKRFGARMQSTLIAFRNGKETGRSVGDTNPKTISDLLAKTI